MRVAVLKIGTRICTSGSTPSTDYMAAKILSKQADVDCYTKIIKREKDKIDNSGRFRIFDIEEDYSKVTKDNYDALIVFNGNVNFYGGVEDRSQIMNYHIMNHFGGKIFYVFDDCRLWLRQSWKTIDGREWTHKYKQSDIELSDNLDITYVSQLYDLESVRKQAQSFDVKINDKVLYFPLSKYLFYYNRMNNFNKTTDLIYGGAFRDGKRTEKLMKFYFDQPEDINVEIFGSIKEKHFDKFKGNIKRYPTFSKRVKFEKILEKLNSSYSICLIGDKFYENNNLPVRIYEAVVSNTVVFVDKQYDMDKKIFTHEKLQKFLYVDSREELTDKIRFLKGLSEEKLKSILDAQYEDTYTSTDDYSQLFYNTIKDNL